MENKEPGRNNGESREVRSESGESEVFSLEELQGGIEDRKLELEMISAEDVGEKEALEQRQAKLGELADLTEQYVQEKTKEPGLERASEFATILAGKGPEMDALEMKRMAAMKIQADREGGELLPLHAPEDVTQAVQAEMDAGATYEDIKAATMQTADTIKRNIEDRAQQNPELKALIGQYQEVAALRKEAKDLDNDIDKEKSKIAQEQRRKDMEAQEEARRQLGETEEPREELPIHDLSKLDPEKRQMLKASDVEAAVAEQLRSQEGETQILSEKDMPTMVIDRKKLQQEGTAKPPTKKKKPWFKFWGKK